jgi:hypothetical protein
VNRTKKRSREWDSAVLNSIELQSGHSRSFQSNRGILLGQVKPITAFRMLGPVFSVDAGMTIQPREKSTNTAGGHSHA